MQKTPAELESEFDALIAEFDLATRGLFDRPCKECFDPSKAYCVAKIIKFPQRETFQ